jgi:hypothetical protein
LICALIAAPAGAALTHRYSFNDGTANDSVGGANGVPVNNPRMVDGGIDLANPQVIAHPSTWQYVDLPNQLARTPALTLETWATSRRAIAWQYIVSLGTGSAGEVSPDSTASFMGTDYVALVATNGRGTMGSIRQGPTLNDEEQTPELLQTTRGMSLNREYHLVYTVDVPAATSVFYMDGQEVARRAITNDPSLHDQVNDWLGRSQFSIDPFFDGTINEFRIYDTALSPAQVAGNFARGPDVVPEPAGALACLLAAAFALLNRR